MRISRSGLIALAIVVASLAGARSASAASYQLCLALDGESGQYFMNFLIQGNAVLVAGDRGHGGQDDHGPLFGSMTPLPASVFEVGVTVTFANAGDYAHQNTENVVFTFAQDGQITYKRWLHAGTPFTAGTASVIACH